MNPLAKAAHLHAAQPHGKIEPVPTNKNSSSEFHRTSLNCSIHAVNTAMFSPCYYTILLSVPPPPQGK